MGESSRKHEISASDLQQLSATLVKQQRLEAPSWDQRSALLTGRMWVSEIEPGMQLRLADVQDRYGLTSQAMLPAGVKIALVIAGTARVRYGSFEAFLGPEASQTGLVAALSSPTRFMRFGQAGGFERTLTLSLSPNWLARHGHGELLVAPPDDSFCPRYWVPSNGLFALASRLFSFHPLEKDNAAHRLQLTGFAMMLAGEALSCSPRVSPTRHPAPALAQPDAQDQRLARLMNMVDDGQARGMTQTDLANHLGMSVSNLQRRFQRQHGEALGSFLRRYHLCVARDAMVHKAASIETAAALAGYTSAANFATAFKREFGVRPSAYRQTMASPH